MKIAYISHHGRPCYELAWLSHLPATEIKILDTDFSKYPQPNGPVTYCQVQYRENWFLNKFLHSTAAHVVYSDFEQYLEDVDVIVVLEIFSSLAKQFVQYAHAHGKKVWVLVYELIANHPIYSLPPYRSYTRYVGREADGFVCVSEQSRQHLVAQGVPLDRSVVVYPGIDLAEFKPSTDHAMNARKEVLFLAKIAPHKGIDIFLAAARANPEHNFSVAGDGPQRPDVEAAARELPNLKYLGQVSHEKVPAVLRQNDIYVMPAIDTYKWGRRIGSEQFGFSLVEAMASGLAVVTTDCGAVAEIVTVNNVVVPQNDGPELLSQLAKLLADDDRCRQMQQANITLVRERYDIVKQAAKLYQVITATNGR